MSNITTVKLAFDYFSKGLASGEWDDFLDVLTEDFSFSFPVAPFQGNNVGKDKAKQFFNYVSQQVFKTGLFLRVERITSNENTVVFEVKSQGLMFDKPYSNQAAISFDVRKYLIYGYREYLRVIYVKNNN